MGGQNLAPGQRVACGGSLIAEGWVLTAAHCITDKDGKSLIGSGHRIRLGVYNPQADEGVSYPILRAVAHPRYHQPSRAFDIALIRFDPRAGEKGAATNAIARIRIDPLPLDQREINAGMPVYTYGWGLTEFRGQSSDHLRGTWARSFKAPTLFQQFIPYQTFLLPAVAFGAGTGASTVAFASGGNPDLRPERARSWTAGFELRPVSAQDLTIAATWFDINYRDRVVQPIAGSIAAAFRDPGFATLINFSPSAAELDDLIAGALFGLENFSGSAFDPANVVALVDNRNINVAVQDIHGIDARIAWSGDLGERRKLGFDLAGTWLESSQQLTSDLPEVQLAGTVFNPPKLRLRGTASFSSAGFRLSSSLNVTGRLTDQRFATESRISPSATLDMSVGYDVIAGEGRDPGLTIALTVNNVLGDRPEVIRTTGPTDTPFDSTNFSPIGRSIALGIRRQW